MNGKAADIYVEEVMTKTPVIAKPDMTIQEAAKIVQAAYHEVAGG